MRVVAIVGRPNVGKSALFNRLAQSRIAIVKDEPGVTRDRIYTEIQWLDRRFTLIDTGGLQPGVDQGFAPSIARQVEAAVSEADVLLLVVDAREGLTPVDSEIAGLLRRSGKTVLVAANKVDSGELESLIYPFYQLGFGKPLPVSAEHGLGTGDLLDAIVANLPPDNLEQVDDADRIRVSVLGRPNVGKSSLINRILGDERVIVSDIPGTTRDAVDVPWENEDGKFVFIDTAGMRRKSRVSTDVEYYSVVRAQRALERSHVSLIVFDAFEGITEQDKRIAGLASEAGRALILVANKWDLVVEANPDTSDLRQQWESRIRYELPLLSFAPVSVVSAMTGRGIRRLPRTITEVYAAFTSHIPTRQLNIVVQAAVDRFHPPTIKGRRLKIHYVTQVRSSPPAFIFFVNDPKLATADYKRYLENQLREAFPLTGTPVRLLFRRS